MIKGVICVMALVACASVVEAQRPAEVRTRQAAPAELKVPRPLLNWRGLDATVKGSDGKPYVGITLGVTNYAAFPSILFERAPELPPCGENRSAARSWLRVFDVATRKEIYNYCALAGPSEMRTFSFNVARAALPSGVYVVLEDRATGRRHSSNCVSTADGTPCKQGPEGGLTGTEVLAQPSVSAEAGFFAVHGREPNPEEAKVWRAAILKEGLTQEKLVRRILERLTTEPDVYAHGEMKMIVQRAFTAAGKGSATEQEKEYWANRILANIAYYAVILEALKKQ